MEVPFAKRKWPCPSNIKCQACNASHPSFSKRLWSKRNWQTKGCDQKTNPFRLCPLRTCEQEHKSLSNAFLHNLPHAPSIRAGMLDLNCLTLFVGHSLRCDWSLRNGAELNGSVYYAITNILKRENCGAVSWLTKCPLVTWHKSLIVCSIEQVWVSD